MKKEDLVDGKIYKLIYGNDRYIFKYKNNLKLDNITKTYNHIYKESLREASSNFHNFNYGTTTLATLSEKKHLEACIAAGKFVEQPKETNYEIY